MLVVYWLLKLSSVWKPFPKHCVAWSLNCFMWCVSGLALLDCLQLILVGPGRDIKRGLSVLHCTVRLGEVFNVIWWESSVVVLWSCIFPLAEFGISLFSGTVKEWNSFLFTVIIKFSKLWTFQNLHLYFFFCLLKRKSWWYQFKKLNTQCLKHFCVYLKSFKIIVCSRQWEAMSGTERHHSYSGKSLFQNQR